MSFPLIKEVRLQEQSDLNHQSSHMLAEQLTPIPEQHNPRSWPALKKTLVCLGPILTAFTGNLSIPICIGSVPGIMVDFNVGTILAISLITLGALGFFVGPLVAVSISEIYGRQSVFFFAIPISLAFNIVAGFAPNFETLAISRFLASVSIAPAVTVAVGVINDVWDVKAEKSGTTIVVLYAAMQVWAAEIGPCAGAAIVHETNDWRWTFWLVAILLGVCALTLINPETYAPEVARRIAKKEGGNVRTRENPIALLKIATGRATHMLFVEPIVWPTAIMAGFYQTIIYCFYVAYPLIFRRVYLFTNYQAGLTFLSLLVGSIIGLVIIALFDKKVYQKTVLEAQQIGVPVEPEGRLYPAILGGILMPVGLFWFASTARPEIHWAVPLMSGLLVGIAFICIMLCLPVYKNDVYGTQYGASALAADNIVRYAFSFSVPLFTTQMINRLGFQWSGNLLGFLSLLLLPIPYIIFKVGPKLRAGSRYKPQVN